MLGKRGGIMSPLMILFMLLHLKEEVCFGNFFNMTFSFFYVISYFAMGLSELEICYNMSINIS